MEVQEDVREGEEFGVHQRSEEKLKYAKKLQKSQIINSERKKSPLLFLLCVVP